MDESSNRYAFLLQVSLTKHVINTTDLCKLCSHDKWVTVLRLIVKQERAEDVPQTRPRHCTPFKLHCAVLCPKTQAHLHFSNEIFRAILLDWLIHASYRARSSGWKRIIDCIMSFWIYIYTLALLTFSLSWRNRRNPSNDQTIYLKNTRREHWPLRFYSQIRV